MAVGALVALDTDRTDVGEQHHRELPDVAVEAGLRELLAGDRVGRPQRVEPVRGHVPDDPDPEAGSGERLAPHDRLGHAELEADGADRPAYAEATGRLGSERATWLACLREGEYKYVVRPYAPERPGRLVDLVADPSEEDDATARIPERAADMRARLLAMLEGAGPDDSGGLSAEEEAAINKRLAELGYLEA